MSVEGFSRKPQPVDAKISALTPDSRAVNVLAKTISKSEVRNIASGRDGASHRVCDALVADETGCIYLTLWDDNIEKVAEEATVSVKNGYINLFKGNMRLNIGRYGTLEVLEDPFEGEVNTENNMSSQVHEQPRRRYGGGNRYGGRPRYGDRPRYNRGRY